MGRNWAENVLFKTLNIEAKYRIAPYSARWMVGLWPLVNYNYQFNFV